MRSGYFKGLQINRFQYFRVFHVKILNQLDSLQEIERFEAETLLLFFCFKCKKSIFFEPALSKVF